MFRELWTIVWIRNRSLQTPFRRAPRQIVLAGAMVFAAGILIGIS